MTAAHSELDIGCGSAKVSGAIGVDKVGTEDVDVLADVEKGLPFRDDAFEKVYMNSVLEHMDDIFKVMDEVHRVLGEKGEVIIRVPCFSHFHALTHPQHRHAFHHESLNCLTSRSKEPYTQKRFVIKRNDYIFKSRLLGKIFNRFKHFYCSTILCYLFPADEILYVLEKEENSHSRQKETNP